MSSLVAINSKSLVIWLMRITWAPGGGVFRAPCSPSRCDQSSGTGGLRKPEPAPLGAGHEGEVARKNFTKVNRGVRISEATWYPARHPTAPPTEERPSKATSSAEVRVTLASRLKVGRWSHGHPVDPLTEERHRKQRPTPLIIMRPDRGGRSRYLVASQGVARDDGIL